MLHQGKTRNIINLALSHRWIKGLVSEDKRKISRISPPQKENFQLVTLLL